MEWKEHPAGGIREKLTDIVAQAADHVETVTDSAAGAGARFYRVVTPRLPWLRKPHLHRFAPESGSAASPGLDDAANCSKAGSQLSYSSVLPK